MDPLSLSTALLTLMQAAGQVIKYIQDVKEGGEEREQLIQEISRLIRLLGGRKKSWTMPKRTIYGLKVIKCLQSLMVQLYSYRKI